MTVIILILFSIFLGLIFPKSRYVNIFILFLFLVLFIFNYNNADYDNYLNVYESLKNPDNGYLDYYNDLEIGFRLLVGIFNKLNISFEVFRASLGLMAITVIFIISNKMTKNINLFISLYLIYSFFTDIVQLRFLLSTSLLVFAFYYLINKKNILGYFILVIISSTFQLYSLFFIILISVFFKRKNWKRFIIIFSLLIVSITIFSLIGIELPILRNISYFKTRTSIITVMGTLIMVIINFSLLLGYYLNSNSNLKKIYFRINIIISIIMIFSIFNVEVNRFFRTLSLVNYFFVADNFYLKKNRFISTVYFFHIVIFGLGYSLIMHLEEVYFPIIKYNYIFEKDILVALFIIIGIGILLIKIIIGGIERNEGDYFSRR